MVEVIDEPVVRVRTGDVQEGNSCFASHGDAEGRNTLHRVRVSKDGRLNLNSAVGHFEKPRKPRNTRENIGFLERRFRKFRISRGESWRFGIVQTFTIWVNPFSVVTYVRGIEKPLFPALSLRTLRSQRLCVRTLTRNLG